MFKQERLFLLPTRCCKKVQGSYETTEYMFLMKFQNLWSETCWTNVIFISLWWNRKLNFNRISFFLFFFFLITVKLHRGKIAWFIRGKKNLHEIHQNHITNYIFKIVIQLEIAFKTYSERIIGQQKPIILYMHHMDYSATFICCERLISHGKYCVSVI